MWIFDRPFPQFIKITICFYAKIFSYKISGNEIIYEYEHPKLGMVRQARPGAKFSESEVRKRSTAPTLGENSEEILSELGLDPLEIEKLFENKIVLGREKE